jgi:hypothetical protein
MHLPKSMSRILIVLLVLRVFAAPIAARPSTFRPYPKAGFIVRVCAWPAQRSQDSVISTQQNGGCGHGENTAIFPSATAQALALLTRVRLLDRVVWTFHGPSSRRPIDSPRC